MHKQDQEFFGPSWEQRHDFERLEEDKEPRGQVRGVPATPCSNYYDSVRRLKNNRKKR